MMSHWTSAWSSGSRRTAEHGAGVGGRRPGLETRRGSASIHGAHWAVTASSVLAVCLQRLEAEALLCVFVHASPMDQPDHPHLQHSQSSYLQPHSLSMHTCHPTAQPHLQPYPTIHPQLQAHIPANLQPYSFSVHAYNQLTHRSKLPSTHTHSPIVQPAVDGLCMDTVHPYIWLYSHILSSYGPIPTPLTLSGQKASHDPTTHLLTVPPPQKPALPSP